MYIVSLVGSLRAPTPANPAGNSPKPAPQPKITQNPTGPVGGSCSGGRGEIPNCLVLLVSQNPATRATAPRTKMRKRIRKRIRKTAILAPNLCGPYLPYISAGRVHICAGPYGTHFATTRESIDIFGLALGINIAHQL
jgi:hypothetical protein